jgi:integrase
MTRDRRGGSIRQLSTRQLWQARYVGADGRRHSIYTRTESEAQERLRAAQAAADHGIRPTSQRFSVGAWLDEWLATSVTARNRASTAASYRAIVERYIRPAVGRLPLAKLEPGDVQRMLDRMGERGLSPVTVRGAHAVLRIAVGRAVKNGYAVRNVATLVDPPKLSHQEPRPLTRDQVSVLRAALAGHRWEALYVAAIGTGLRQGELLRLSWSDVDLDAGTLTVRGETKTAGSRRALRLALPVIVVLRRLPRLTPSLIFCTRTGRPLDPRNVTRELQRVLAAAGLPRQRFHDLRHAFATLQLEAGADLYEVSRALGHASIATTANVYAHWTAAMAEQSAERMSEILGG